MSKSQNCVLSYFLRLIGCVLAGTLCSVSHAQEQQQYTIAPIKLPQNEVGKARISFESANRSPTGFGAGEADVNAYLKNYFFPKMTQVSPNDLAELADQRKNMITKHIPQAGNAASREYLIDQTFNYARVMARGNFHPAVRYNAVLMLGELDQQLASGSNPPVPYGKATLELLELVEQEEFNKIAVPESVKLGALIGLERHAQFGIDPALNDRLTKAMIAVMTSPTPEDVEASVHDWLRSSAASVLANQFAKSPNQEVQAAISKLIADKTVVLDDRCAAAATLKKFSYAAGTDIDSNATLAALAQLTVDVIADAGKLARDYQKEALGQADFSTMRGGYGGGGRGYGGEFGGRYGGGYGREEELGPRFERRQLYSRLHSIAQGAGSLKVALSDEGQSRVDALMAELAPVVRVMDDKGATEVDVTQEVLALETSLKNLVESWNLPAQEADVVRPAEGLAER